MPYPHFRWRPGFSDHSLEGWLATICFFVACVLCILAARRQARPGPDRDMRLAIFWAALAAGLAFLGLNKQLDLQTLLTDIGRSASHSQGWYDARREFQKVFVAVVAVFGAGCLAGLLYLIHKQWRRQILALAGGVLLACFLGMRIAAMEHIDEAFGVNLESHFAETLLEIGGTICIVIAAWRDWRRGA